MSGGDELSDLDIWANQLRDSILEQVHSALDAYEQASQENISSLFAREVSQRSEALATVVAQRTVAMEDRLNALEAFAQEARASAQGGAAEQPGPEPRQRSPSQEAALESRLAALEARGQAPAFVPPPVDSSSLRPAPLPREDVATTAALSATTSQFVKGLQALEGEILVLQGELVMLQTRTQMQGVSGSIFSLRAVDMDERSRVKSLEVLVKKEGEVKRLMDTAHQAKERGGMAELLTQLGVRVTKSPATGDLQVLNFSLAEGESNGDFNGMPSSNGKAERRAESVGRV